MFQRGTVLDAVEQGRVFGKFLEKCTILKMRWHKRHRNARFFVRERRLGGETGQEERRFRRSRDSGSSLQQEAPIRNRAFRHKNCRTLADIVHFGGFCATLVAGHDRQASKDGARHSIPQLESA